MNLFSEVQAKAGHPRRVVKEVYSTLISVVHRELKNERRIRLPELGILKIGFRPAREKRKGISPFNGKPMTFKAKPAMNKIRFSPTKDLKEWANAKVAVVRPKKK